MTPEDRQKKFDEIIKSEEHDDLLSGVIWGRNDGHLGVDEFGDGECSFCDEALTKRSVDVSDVCDSLRLCLRCGKLFVVHAKKVIQSWVDGDLAEREKEIDEALKEEGDGN